MKSQSFCILFTPLSGLEPWLTLSPSLVRYVSAEVRDHAFGQYERGELGGFRPGEWMAEKVDKAVRKFKPRA